MVPESYAQSYKYLFSRSDVSYLGRALRVIYVSIDRFYYRARGITVNNNNDDNDNDRIARRASVLYARPARSIHKSSKTR